MPIYLPSTAHTHSISDTTGLQTALDGKAASSHTHSASAITSGVLDKAQLGLTTNGDLLTVISGVLARLGLGSALQVLRVNAAGNALEFAAPAGGGGGILGVVEKTADYTLLTADKDYMFLMNSGSNRQFTVNGSLDLPDGGMIHLGRKGAGEVTIVASGATVNSASGLRLRAQNSSATLIRTGTDEYLLQGDLKV